MVLGGFRRHGTKSTFLVGWPWKAMDSQSLESMLLNDYLPKVFTRSSASQSMFAITVQRFSMMLLHVSLWTPRACGYLMRSHELSVAAVFGQVSNWVILLSKLAWSLPSSSSKQIKLSKHHMPPSSRMEEVLCCSFEPPNLQNEPNICK